MLRGGNSWALRFSKALVHTSARLPNMRGMRHLPTALAGLAAMALASGWYLSEHSGTERDFLSCERTGSTLTLTFSHSPGQDVSVTREPRGNGDVAVSLKVEASGDANVASAVTSSAQFDDLWGRVYYRDGRELECKGDAAEPRR